MDKKNPLTVADCEVILASLRHTLKAINETEIEPQGTYPSYEFKVENMVKVEQAIIRVRELHDQLKGKDKRSIENNLLSGI